MTIEDEYEEFCKELMDENRSLRKQLAAKCNMCKKYERQKTATEILRHLYEMGENEKNFQDGTVNTQLEPLYFGISNGVSYMLDEILKMDKFISY